MKTRILQFAVTLLAFGIIYACSLGDAESVSGSDNSGTGGSLARFTIVGEHLYTVDNENLSVFDISVEELPEFEKTKEIGNGVETIFPLGDNLFLGTTSGMYIYEIENEGDPQLISFYEHVISCDPVVSDGNFAYVTLSSVRESCWRSVNELQIINLQNILNPVPVSSFPMNNPLGLAVRNDTLWICDDGIKIYDVSNKQEIRELFHFKNLIASDVILDKDRALVIGETGFVQYKLKNETIQKLSEINVEY